MPQSITRLAPSPTGALHLGNARTFLVNYLLARQRGWEVLMRVEDLDGPRIKAGAAEQMLAELAWLGLTWPEPVVYQSALQERYKTALSQLAAAGMAYPCICSRKDIELAAAAPHAEDAVQTYPNTCRGRFASAEEARAHVGRPAAWRVRVGPEPIRFWDEFQGDQEFDLSQTCGDFVIFRSGDIAAYQLAVVVDDAAAGVDAVVRGDDLLESAARQIHLRRLLGIDGEPTYWHLPLVVGPDGRRLAKRHGDTRLGYYRDRGATPQRMLGLLGHWCGAVETRQPATMEELIDRFELDRLPSRPIVFSPADDAFLCGR